MQLHEQYGWEMNCWQALSLARRIEVLSPQEYEEAKTVLEHDAVVPRHLLPTMERLYLLQLRPANRLPA